MRVIPIGAAAGAAAPALLPPPLALYVHFPWCVRKCPYCDFNSHEARGGIPESEYVDAVLADITAALPGVWGRRIASVFFGGGTPSLLSPAALDRLLAGIRALLAPAADAEFTLEANPGTVDAAHFASFRAAGINRLSLGVQSFSDRHLAALGRIHSADEARRAAELALRHFDNVNFDLMYALPGQTPDEAGSDIVEALRLGPSHISAYQLGIEPNTAFHRAPPPLPDEDSAAAMQETVEAMLAEVGFRHYEVSAFARAGRVCRHNLNYWNFGDYLGVGPGAHSKLTSSEGIVREVRHRHPNAYLAAAGEGNFIQERHAVEAADRPVEFMMNALRLVDGFAPSLYAERTGLSLAALQQPLLAAQRQELLEVTTERIAATERGRRYLNRLLGLFVAG